MEVQRCGGAEVRRCRGAEVQRCRGAGTNHDPVGDVAAGVAAVEGDAAEDEGLPAPPGGDVVWWGELGERRSS